MDASLLMFKDDSGMLINKHLLTITIFTIGALYFFSIIIFKLFFIKNNLKIKETKQIKFNNIKKPKMIMIFNPKVI